MNPQFSKALCSSQAVPHSPHSSTCPSVPGEWPKLALQALPAAQTHGWAARDQCQSHTVWAGGCSMARMCHRCLAEQSRHSTVTPQSQAGSQQDRKAWGQAWDVISVVISVPLTALGIKYSNNTSRKKPEKLSPHTVTQEETLRSAAGLL